ncbi:MULTISPECIES: ATP-binding protein [unclassified Streptomyces]|uniref:ATP-binding protein n=1 Tax=unclassified Streptomyces TaxID=2593676 RepID=UPI000ACDD75B
MDLTAYRIIQEALTNATKHASDHQAQVHLSYAHARLRLAVTNYGPPVAPAVPGGGYGLMGMRERAASVGGALHAGPRSQGGFQVTATLPLQPLSQAEALADRPEPEEQR